MALTLSHYNTKGTSDGEEARQRGAKRQKRPKKGLELDAFARLLRSVTNLLPYQYQPTTPE